MLFVMLKVFGPVVTSIFVVNYTTDITESVIEKSDFIDVADGSIKRWSVDKNIPRAWAHGLKTFACSAKLFNSPERNTYRIVPKNRSGTNNLRCASKKDKAFQILIFEKTDTPFLLTVLAKHAGNTCVLCCLKSNYKKWAGL